MKFLFDLIGTIISAIFGKDIAKKTSDNIADAGKDIFDKVT